VNEPRWFRLPRILRRNVRAEVGDEIAFHIQMRTAELIEQGVDPARAREMAEVRFGPVPPIEQELTSSIRRRRQREDRADAFLDLTQDIRFAIRSLRRAPAFTTAAVGTLALGIGATLAVFNVVNGVLLRPLPYHDPARIQMIWITNTNEAGERSDLPLSSGFYLDIERQAGRFESMAAFRAWSYVLTAAGNDEAEPLSGARVSPALFSVLGTRPVLGQPFTAMDAVPGAPNVALISHDLWQRRFGGDRTIVGRLVTLNGQSFTVTGVMPPGFAFPRGAELPTTFGFGLRTQVWTPLVFDSSDARNYGTMNLSAVGRLGTDAMAPAAQQELSVIMKAFLKENAPRLKLDYRVLSMADQAGQKVERALLILLAAVMLVLTIATANVASLLVARVSSRARELAVRAALGAGRARIARQLVTENVVLALAGTVLGLAVAWWTTRVMLALVPGSMPRADDIGLDWRVLAFAALVTLVAGAGFAVAAAFAVKWSRLGSALHEGDVRSGGSLRQRYGRRLLAATEVALSLMLLIGAALLTRSFLALQNERLGFDPSHVVTASISIPVPGRFLPAQDGPRWSGTMNQVAARLASATGIDAAGMVSGLPLSGSFESGGVRLPGVTYEAGQAQSTQYNVVAGDYFKAAGIRLLAGRTFDASDDPAGRSTIVINRVLARQFFGSESAALGRDVIAMFEFDRDRPPRTVIGVVDVVKQLSADEEPTAQVYVPVSQMAYPGLTLVVRASGSATRDLRSLLTTIKREVRAVDPSATVDDVRTMDDVVSHSLARQRFNMTLVGVFAALALVLAMVGLYGVITLIVGQRRREIGVRLALGAAPRTVIGMILREGAFMTGSGVALGILGALALTRAMAALLYGVSATDPWTFSTAAVLVVAVALVATYAPARRASRMDPRTALSSE
jgi:putative ABC transport system permease protein